MKKKVLLAVSLMVLGTCLIAAALPLQFWSAPEEPSSDPPVMPDFANITDPEIREIQRKVYAQAMETYQEDQEQYEEEVTEWAFAMLFSLWFPWVGLCCLFWGLFFYVDVHSTKTPLEEYNEVQCHHCGKWIKRSWKTCPFCSKVQ